MYFFFFKQTTAYEMRISDWSSDVCSSDLCLCNDRRWPETYRVMALQGAEMILLGYNTPRFFPQLPKLSHLADFHSHLVMQAGAYQSGAWVVGTAKAGWEEGCDLIGEIGRAHD